MQIVVHFLYFCMYTFDSVLKVSTEYFVQYSCGSVSFLCTACYVLRRYIAPSFFLINKGTARFVSFSGPFSTLVISHVQPMIKEGTHNGL